ncbi:MAG TPA: hypothetical protein VE553_05555 [Candidatus Binatia bacterium]|nr:hypothetical protein [Candidatus Binatia bacterium]
MRKQSRRFILFVVVSSLLVAACSQTNKSDEASPGDTVQAAAQAFVDGYDNGSLDQFDTFFAPVSQANQAGLANTQDAAHKRVDEAEPGANMEINDLTITNENIDEQRQEAVVTYDAKVTFLIGTDVVSSFLVTQNVALKRIDGRWLISGGDEPQIESGQN